MLRPQVRQLGSKLARRCISTEASPPPLAPLLLQLAVPLIPSYGFSSATLTAASLKLPPPHTPSPPGYPKSTIDALFPSLPPSEKRRSKNREELIAELRGSRTADGDEERLGPATALVEEWLKVGRKEMAEHVVNSGKTGDAALQVGLRRRLRYNEDVLVMLPAALALLSGTPSKSPLSSITALIPVPSPFGYLEHVARIAQDLAYASGDEGQGLAWYKTRARIATIYALAEIHLISPKNAVLPHEERMRTTFELVDRLISHSDLLAQKVNDAEQFSNWVTKSWMGIGRSMGL